MDAYKLLNHPMKFVCFFPVMHFKQLVYQLDFEVVRKLLTCSGELTSIIKEIYDKKLNEKSIEKSSNPEIQGAIKKMDMVKRTIEKHSDDLPRITVISIAEHHNTVFGMRSEENKVGSISYSVFQSKLQSSNWPHQEELKVPYSVAMRMSHCNEQGSLLPKPIFSTEKNRVFVNDYPKACKFKDPNPCVVIVSALKDLTNLLYSSKNKGLSIFHAAGQSKHFELICKEAAAMRVFSLSSI